MAETRQRTSQNPERFKVRDGKVYPDGKTTPVDLTVPGFGQTDQFDPNSEEAQKKVGGTALDLTKPVGDMTHAELDAYAAQQDPPVDLAGTTTRQDKIDRIEAAASGGGGGS